MRLVKIADHYLNLEHVVAVGRNLTFPERSAIIYTTAAGAAGILHCADITADELAKEIAGAAEQLRKLEPGAT